MESTLRHDPIVGSTDFDFILFIVIEDSTCKEKVQRSG